MKIFLTLFTLLLFSFTAFAAEKNLDATQALISLLNKTHSLSSDFTQNIYDETGHLIDHSSGTLKLAKPNLFRWEVQKPMTQLVVSNSQQVWVYDPDLQQVIIKPVDHTLSVTPLSILSGSSDVLSKNFKITKTKAGYQLISKAEDLNFNTIDLGFAQDHISSMTLFDNLGQKTELVFSHLVSNPVFPPHTFDFKPPKGIDIVDATSH